MRTEHCERCIKENTSECNKCIYVTNEQWMPIVGYENYYEISNFGNVRSKGNTYCTKNGTAKYLNGRLMKPGINKRGYLSIRLSINRVSRSFYVHRLVADAFITNPNNYPMVNHKDCNRINNHYLNLEWCTVKYNNTYGDLSVNKMKPVDQYDTKGNFIKRYGSMKEAGEALNVDPNQIGSVCTHTRNTARGYKWEYADAQTTADKNTKDLSNEDLCKLLVTIEEKLTRLLEIEAKRIKGEDD